MEEGPAFIQYKLYLWHRRTAVPTEEPLAIRGRLSVPSGYIWRPQTLGTAAGWVRPCAP